MTLARLNFGLLICSVAMFACWGTVARAEIILASDDANQAAYNSGYNIGDNGGTGFNPWAILENNGGGTFLEQSGREVAGSRSWGIFAGGSGSFAAGRELQTSLNNGRIRLTARHDNDGSNFSGFNLKNTSSGGFGNGEMISFGIADDNNGATSNDFHKILVTDSSGASHAIDFGEELRGAVLDYDIIFSTSGTYELFVTKDGGTTMSTTGSFASAGPVVAIGVGNFISSGSNQNLIFDSFIASTPEPGSFIMFATIAGVAFRRRRKSS